MAEDFCIRNATKIGGAAGRARAEHMHQRTTRSEQTGGACPGAPKSFTINSTLFNAMPEAAGPVFLQTPSYTLPRAEIRSEWDARARYVITKLRGALRLPTSERENLSSALTVITRNAVNATRGCQWIQLELPGPGGVDQPRHALLLELTSHVHVPVRLRPASDDRVSNDSKVSFSLSRLCAANPSHEACRGLTLLSKTPHAGLATRFGHQGEFLSLADCQYLAYLKNNKGKLGKCWNYFGGPYCQMAFVAILEIPGEIAPSFLGQNPAWSSRKISARASRASTLQFILQLLYVCVDFYMETLKRIVKPLEAAISVILAPKNSASVDWRDVASHYFQRRESAQHAGDTDSCNTSGRSKCENVLKQRQETSVLGMDHHASLLTEYGSASQNHQNASS
ncbi:uncharacterized protein BDR25DRAFT_354745 [Lindgomyces ingoldianus]|uniref:Uncharacterized protein n=1 Tax=Lindgomyces ingoldianus TaxID=673940 RepID=A0ACB6QY83_9PLEO|nr:uncharacterized protein BDR25DRAFT_354745 [Lindgomyces ingoldianus]KAF2471490.1 hypothetical protein BDR25DRAFT_354745 [Lindgomyces ingoldianus]